MTVAGDYNSVIDDLRQPQSEARETVREGRNQSVSLVVRHLLLHQPRIAVKSIVENVLGNEGNAAKCRAAQHELEWKFPKARIDASCPLLIACDTVEEEVLQLQESKRSLADTIIGAQNSLIRDLRPEDIELFLS